MVPTARYRGKWQAMNLRELAGRAPRCGAGWVRGLCGHGPQLLCAVAALVAPAGCCSPSRAAAPEDTRATAATIGGPRAAAPAPQPESLPGAELRLLKDTAEPKTLQKVEFTVHVARTYRNPFDPAEVDLSVEFLAPSGKRLRVPAFFAQPFERRRIEAGRAGRDWIYPAGHPGWKARFTPLEPGDYQAVAHLRDARGETVSPAVRFRCQQAAGKGFLRAAAGDARYLELSTREPFFAIGQNLCYIRLGQGIDLTRAEQMFARLAANGANYLRIWTCCEDWALSLEARRSAYTRSWNWRLPVVRAGDGGAQPAAWAVALGGQFGQSLAAQPVHPLAVRPATEYSLSGQMLAEQGANLHVSAGGSGELGSVPAEGNKNWRDFRLALRTRAEQYWLDGITFRAAGPGRLLLRELRLSEAAGGPNLLLDADPNQPALGYYHQPDCYMLDQLVEAAERAGLYLQLCLLTRNLYMDLLRDPSDPEYDEALRCAKNMLRYAVARWGYSTHVAAWEYFNEMDPNRPTDRFYDELGAYLEQIDIYRHLRTTSTWHPSARDCAHARIDLPQLHHYLRPALGEAWKDEVAAVAEKNAFLRKHSGSKPVLIGEFGLADDRYGASPLMKQDRALVHFHNSLWASAFSGSAGTALFWWWDELDAMDAYPHYRPLAGFFKGEPLAAAGLEPGSAACRPERLKALVLKGQQRAYLWLFDLNCTWWNMVEGGASAEQIGNASLELAGLAPGTYRVLWWDTYEGRVLGEEAARAVAPGSAQPAVLRLRVPAFSRDVACKIAPSE